MSGYRPLYCSPLKRALVHMLRHGGLKRNNNWGVWTGTTDGQGVRFKDVTIIAAGECGLIKISVNRKQRARQFASLTPKGVEIATAVDAMLTARRLVEKTLNAAPKQKTKVTEEAVS